MIAQAVTELDNTAAHRQLPVLDQNTPFFRCILDCQINNFSYRVIRWEHLVLLDSFADHAVQRLNGIRGVDSFSDVRRILAR